MGGVTVVHNIAMDDMQPIDMRRRIRELLSIPERDRTDAEWDELNELEIRTAPGNRDYDRGMDRPPERRQGAMGQGQGQGRRADRNPKQGNKNGNAPRQQGDGRPEGRLLKRQHRRPKRQGENQPNAGNATPAPVSAPESTPGGDKSEG